MITETSVEKLTALFFFVTGVSHIVQPRAWIRFFIMLREKGEVGSFLNALIHFPLGAFIVAFHNVWHGIPLIVTLVGWGLTVKSTIYFFSRGTEPGCSARFRWSDRGTSSWPVFSASCWLW